MKVSQSKPVIFLAYANDRQQGGGFLRSLGQEATRVQEALESAYEENLCDIVIRMGVTPEGMIKVLGDRHLKNRIAIFHFAGHADDYLLLLEGARGEVVATDAQALAGYLQSLQGLQLVFLNACSTRAQVDDLLAAGVAVVIATSAAIIDELAAEFAVQFYASLAAGEKLQVAFDKAQLAVKFIHAELIAQARPTGDEHATNELPWALYVRPGTEAMLEWDLPAAANNPLFGLPQLPDQPLPHNPYRHLDWYRSEDAAIFFGRGREIRQIYRAITNRGTAPLILLCGQSGVGKSSLLAAGLLPRLAGSHTVHYLRRKADRGMTVTLQESLGCGPEPKALAAAWLAAEQRTNQPLLIVLDQVEEVYTRPQPALDQDKDDMTKGELAEFLQRLQAIFVNAAQKPSGKLLLGFRKEWLAEIEKNVKAVGIWHVTEFLDRLDRQGVIEVITGPLQTPQLAAQYKLQLAADDLPWQIADDLLADHNSVVAPTLQILLHTMWEKAKQHQADPVFDRALYDKLRQEGLGLADFLNRQLAQLAALQPQAVTSGLVLDLLHFHITNLDTAGQREPDLLRQTYAYHPEHHTLRHTYQQQLAGYLEKFQPRLARWVKPVSAAPLSATDWEQGRERLIQHCVDHYLLTFVTTQQASPPDTRLAHDTLAPLVRDRFEKSIAPGQRARRILENRAVDWADHKHGVALDDADLAIVEAGNRGMRSWHEAEKRLIQASRVARQRRQLIRLVPWVAALLIALLILGSEQLAAIWTDNTQISEADARAQLALRQLPSDPHRAAQAVSNVLPNHTTRAYVAQAEFAYTEALHQDWEVARVQPNPHLAAVNRVDANRSYLALGSDALAIVTQPEMRAITLTTAGQNILGVAWSQAGRLLAYDADQVRLWNELEPGKFGESVASKAFPPDAGPLTCAEWHPSGNLIAICQGKMLWLWRLTTDTNEVIYEFSNQIMGDDDQRHQRWSPTGQRLVAWDADRTLLLWDSATLTATTQISVHQALIWDVAWSDDERYLVTVSGDRTAKIWSVPALLATEPLSLTTSVQGDSPLLARVGVRFVNDQHFLTWGFDSIVRQWDVQGNLLKSYDTRHGVVTAVHPGRNASEFLVLLTDGSAQLWDLAGDTELATFRGHERQILATAWHDNYLATASADGTARIWQGTTGGPLATLIGHKDGLTTGRPDVLTIAWQDDQYLVSTGLDGTVRRWRFVNDRDPFCTDWGSAQPPQCYGLSQRILAHSARILAAQWLNDTTLVSVDSQGNARLWEAGQPAQPVWELPVVKGRRTRLNPDGQALFTYLPKLEGDQPAGQLWNLTTRQPIATFQSNSPLTSTHWLGQHLLINRTGAPPVIIDGNSGLTLTTLADPGAFYTAVQLAGDQLATADHQGQLRLWHLPDGEPLAHWPVEEQARVSHLVWLAQGERLLLATGTSTVTLHHAQTGELLWSTPLSDAVKSIALSPDETLLAIASGQTSVVLRTADGAQVWAQADPAATISGVQWVMRPAWSTLNFYRRWGHAVYRWFGDDPRRLADAHLLLMTWGGDGMVHFWHWDSRTEILRLREQVKPNTTDTRYPITSALLSRDHTHLVTAGDSGELRFWQIWLDQPARLWDLLAERR